MNKIRNDVFISINERPRIANKFVEDLKFRGRNDIFQFKTHNEISRRLVKLISILIIQDAYSEIDGKDKQKIEDEALRGSKFGKIHS